MLCFLLQLANDLMSMNMQYMYILVNTDFYIDYFEKFYWS